MAFSNFGTQNLPSSVYSYGFQFYRQEKIRGPFGVLDIRSSFRCCLPGVFFMVIFWGFGFWSILEVEEMGVVGGLFVKSNFFFSARITSQEKPVYWFTRDNETFQSKIDQKNSKIYMSALIDMLR